MKNLIFLFAFILFATNSFATTPDTTLETNCVVILELGKQDSLENKDFIVTVGNNRITFDCLDSARSFTINMTDTVTNDEYYDGYERVLETKTTDTSINANILYREGKIVVVGILKEDGTEHFWMFNPSF